MRGAQIDSLRHWLGTQAVKYNDPSIRMGLPELRPLWEEATENMANQALIEEAPGSFVPRPGAGMIDREFKQPWNNRYVMQVKYRDPATGETGVTDWSIHSNRDLSKSEAERAGMDDASNWGTEARAKYLPEGVEIVSVEMVNAYHNA